MMIAKADCFDKPQFEDYIGLVKRLALKFRVQKYNAPVEDSEEYSVACMALVKAMQEYSRFKSRFSTYAYVCIRNALIHYIRRNRSAPDFVDPKDIEMVAESRNCTLDPRLIDLFLSESEGDEEYDKLDKLMLRDYYLHQMTLQDIATKHGVSKMRVKQRVDRAINRIRRKYKSYIGEWE